MHARLLALAIATTIPAASPVAAQDQNKPGYDPNEKVCENVTAIGSRLAKKRICATRAEWAERNRLDREAVAQAQKQIVGPCQTTPSGRNGGPTAC